jgi:hypothetical protein
MDLAEHFDHDIVIAKYSSWEKPTDYALECETCEEVIIVRKA